MTLRISTFAAVALALAACHPTPPTPAIPDASDASAPVKLDAAPNPSASILANAACANLADLGCAEGSAPNCAEVLDHVVATRLTDPHMGCLAIAMSKASARACGSVRCP